MELGSDSVADGPHPLKTKRENANTQNVRLRDRNIDSIPLIDGKKRGFASEDTKPL
jgi:hypothetical protein